MYEGEADKATDYGLAISQLRELRAEIERLTAQNNRMRAVLYACHHTLTVHGHIDADTDLHQRISNEA
jgi:hypothetical protein